MIVEENMLVETQPLKTNTLRSIVQACRLHQWIKNTLIFVPLVTSHEITNLDQLLQAGYAFLAFGLCASSVYIVNDLMDVEHDRKHAVKRHRPFASGALQPGTGVVLAVVLFATGLAIAGWLLTPLFIGLLLLYLIASNSYSFFFKRVAVMDVLMLAGLYTLRILCGGVATGIPISHWLLAFATFFFLSLAFIKRYAELARVQEEDRQHASGRGYLVGDLELIRSLGPASGYLSVLVLALYIQSTNVVELYQQPTILWLIGPCLLFWITRLWLLAHRGVVTDDPILFTVKDPVSYAVGAVVALIIVGATL